MNQAVEVPLLDGYLKVECFFIGGRYCQSKWFYPIDPVEVMPSHWKKSSKNSLQDRYANAQQKFDLCKLLSRRGICQETLDEQHPGDLCHHFVCPGTSERQLQWRTSWPPHFWKIPWFGCFKAVLLTTRSIMAQYDYHAYLPAPVCSIWSLIIKDHELNVRMNWILKPVMYSHLLRA